MRASRKTSIHLGMPDVRLSAGRSEAHENRR
jgi:hypothetical protein